MINLENFDSINQTHKADRVTDRYSFIPTTQILDVLATQDWLPVKVNESRTIKEDRKGFQKHMIHLRQNSNNEVLSINELITEIVLTNSHDGLASFGLDCGIYRCICSNQMIVSDTMIATHRIRHTGYTNKKVIDAMASITEDTPKVLAQVDNFKQIELNSDERRIFGETSLDLIFNDKRLEKINKDDTVTALIQPKRPAETAPTLWQTFNTVQEKALKGGYWIKEKPEIEDRSYSPTRKAKEVKAIDRNIKLNKALWTLTEKMAEIKSGK